ncbi:hypothetical protein ABI59_23750 [Acidobacteria bacterium Mor1]|nr:hypothetical protein ABI59_23750 [Acidobacteria bacterium Mor1]
MKRRTIPLLLWLLALPGLVSAQSPADAPRSDRWDDYGVSTSDLGEERENQYASGDFGRITYEENGVTILRDETEPDAENDRGTLNAPLFPGDTLVTDYDQRIEIEFAGGTLIRVDRDTALKLLALPSPYATYEDNFVLQLERGSIRIESEIGEREFRIDTPASSVYLLEDGDFEVTVETRGATRVASWRGVAEIAGSGGSVLVRAGNAGEVLPGRIPDDPRPFNTLARSDFSDWVDGRQDTYLTAHNQTVVYRDGERYEAGAVYDELPDEVRPHYSELSRHGEWVWSEDYGWVWSPSGVRTGWRPYTDGYWHYGRRGYFWVADEPWGWAPYRYGRWNWLAGRGWCWAPGRVFGGAWVSWSFGNLHVGWAPLNFWNRPAYVRLSSRGFYDPLCWNFVGYRHFGHRYYRHHRLHLNDVRPHLGRHAIVTRAPRVSPRALARDDGARRRIHDRARAHRIDRPWDRDRRAGRDGFRDRERERDGRRIADRGRRGGGGRQIDSDIGRVPRGRRVGDETPGRNGGTRLGRRGDSPRDSGASSYPRRILRDQRNVERGRDRLRPETDPRARQGRRGDGNRQDMYRRLGRSSETSRRQAADNPRRGGDRRGPVADNPRRGGDRRGPSAGTPRRGDNGRRDSIDRRSGTRSPRVTPQPRPRPDRPSAGRQGNSGRRPSMRPGSGSTPRRPQSPSARSGSDRRNPTAGPRTGNRPGRPSAGARRNPSPQRPSVRPGSGRTQRPSVRPGSGNRPSRPSATPRSGSRPRPKASGGNRGGGSKRPSAQRGGNRGGGSKQKSGGRARGGNSRGKAKRR